MSRRGGAAAVRRDLRPGPEAEASEGEAWAPADWIGGVLFHYEATYTDTGSDGDADEWANEAGSFPDAVTAFAPAITDPDNELTTGKSLAFDGTGTYFTNVGTLLQARPFHNGEGAGIAVLFKGTTADGSQGIAATAGTLGSQVGFLMRYSGTTETAYLYIHDGVNTLVSESFAVSLNQWAVFGFYFEDKTPGVGATGIDDWEVWYANAASAASVVASGELGASDSPNTGDPENRLGLGTGNGNVGSWRFNGRIGAIVGGVGDDLENAMAYLRGLIA